MNAALPFGQRILTSVAASLAPLTKSLGPYVGDADFVLVPAFVAFFVQLFVTNVMFWRYVMSSNLKQTPRLASYGVSMVHALVVSFASWPELATWWTSSSLALDTSNTWIQTMILQYSLAYMIFDFMYMLAFDPNDFLMLGHHILAGAYNVVALRLKVGAVSAILPFFMGELSTPLFNAFNVTKEFRATRLWAKRFFPTASTAFTIAFVLCRTVLGVPVMAWFVVRMLTASPGIPGPWAAFMAFAVFFGMIGSQIWSFKLIRGWKKMMRGTPSDDGSSRKGDAAATDPH